MKNFVYNNYQLESSDEIIFMSFLDPDDEDDIEGLFNEAHRKRYYAIAKKTGRDA